MRMAKPTMKFRPHKPAILAVQLLSLLATEPSVRVNWTCPRRQTSKVNRFIILSANLRPSKIGW